MRSLTMNLTLAVAATFGLAAFSGVVRAADMPVEYPPIIEAPEPMPLPAVGGWYLRGDIGYKYYQAPKGVLSTRDWGSFGNNGEFGSQKMQGAADFGVGVGYKFNDYLRTDLTFDYETPAKYRGSAFCQDVTAPHNCPPAPSGRWEKTESAKITAYSALANVYADLGDFQGFKPYVGAGAGASYLRTSDVKSSAQDGNTGNYPSGAGKWNFAWALMAGVEYPITDRLSLDLGYRYLNLGDAETGSVSEGAAGTGKVTKIKYENIQAHEVRLGLRYYLN